MLMPMLSNPPLSTINTAGVLKSTPRCLASAARRSGHPYQLACPTQSVRHFVCADRQSVVLESTDVIGQKGLGESLGILDMFGDHDEDENATDSVADSHFVKQLALLLKCKLYVCVTMSLTGLYFVVTGIQFWVTDYLTLPIAEGGMGEDLGTVVIGFSICSLTGPTVGLAINNSLETC